MGRTCFVPNCKTGYKSQRTERISLFRPPQHKLSEWQRVIPRKDRVLSIKDSICEKHFLQEYICREVNNDLFLYPLLHPKLTEDAIPTIFPGCPSSLSEEINKTRLVEKHEIPEIKELESVQITSDISIKDENEAEVVHNSSQAFEFKDQAEIVNNSSQAFEFKDEAEIVNNFSQAFEFKDNLEFKDEAEIVNNSSQAFKFKDEAEIVNNSSQAFELKDDLEFIDEEEAEVVHSSTQVIKFKDVQNTIFLQILQNVCIITLPSEAWAAHKFAIGGDRRICFSEMISIENYNMIVRKKLVLTKDAIKIFVFDHVIDGDVIFSCENVNTPAEFQNGLSKFHNLHVCCGGLPVKAVQSNFNNVLYFKDHYLNVWRHVSCSYILPTETVENIFARYRGRTCSHCHKHRRAVANFKYRLTKIADRVSRKQKAQRIAANLRRSEKKLKIRNQEIKLELRNARRKIKELDEEGLASKISALDIPASQKLLLQECINTCKYNRKSSRRYDSEWLLFCLLLHIRGPATYNFLRSNDILPLPAGSTVRKYLTKNNIKCGLDEKFFKKFKLKMREKKK